MKLDAVINERSGVCALVYMIEHLVHHHSASHTVHRRLTQNEDESDVPSKEKNQIDA